MQLRDRGVHALLPVPGVERFNARLQRIQIDTIGVLLKYQDDIVRIDPARADRLLEEARADAAA